MPLSVRPGFFFFGNLDWDVNDHTPVSQTGSVVWSLTSQVKKGIKKPRSVRPWYGLWRSDANCDRKNTLVWQTVVWPLRLQKPGLSDRGVANGVTKFHMTSGGLTKWYLLRIRYRTLILRLGSYTLLMILFKIWSVRNDISPSYTGPIFPWSFRQIILTECARRFAGFLHYIRDWLEGLSLQKLSWTVQLLFFCVQCKHWQNFMA